MSGEVVARLGAIAEQRWGLLTAAQAAAAGVSRMQLSRLASAGALVRVAQGVYRVAGAPELEREPIYAAWLALGGANSSADGRTVPPVVAAGVTAAVVHQIGDFYPNGAEFIVPTRRGTRLDGVRLRARQLAPQDVTWTDGLPALTVELTIADLVRHRVDTSLIADALKDAGAAGKITNPEALLQALSPLAEHDGAGGQNLAQELYQLTGLATVDEWS